METFRELFNLVGFCLNWGNEILVCLFDRFFYLICLTYKGKIKIVVLVSVNYSSAGAFFFFQISEHFWGLTSSFGGVFLVLLYGWGCYRKAFLLWTMYFYGLNGTTFVFVSVSSRFLGKNIRTGQSNSDTCPINSLCILQLFAFECWELEEIFCDWDLKWSC